MIKEEDNKMLRAIQQQSDQEIHEEELKLQRRKRTKEEMRKFLLQQMDEKK
jgi:hypothetical protein